MTHKRHGPRARSKWQDLYDTPEWRAIRKRQLALNPFCAMCAKRGQRVKAAIADHIEPHRGDRIKFFTGRLQSLCKHDHDSVKQSNERGRRAGCDEHGLPVDRSHPWSGR